jgi:predicted metal-binding membrane protein
MADALEAALARHRALSIAALIVLTLLAWAWLLAGAGMAMDPLVSLAPAASGESAMDGMAMDMVMPWSPAYFALVASMWWVMMIAMMLPSAAPMILLYARAATGGNSAASPATGAFVAGYLIAWAAFSLAATVLHYLLEGGGLIASALMASQSRALSAAILILAGIYQLSPVKDVCLRHCRNPARFLSRHYRPGAAGALRMGLVHGAFCVGCCWLLMALLFVGGVMNLAWIALLTLMVAAEKLLPFGRALAIASGIAFVCWGAAILLR